MKKYLILGGNGFLGKHITNSLLKDGNNEIVIADLNIENQIESERITYKQIDFGNCTDFSDYLKGVDTVFHLISSLGPSENIDNIQEDIKNDVFPTINLLNELSKMEHTKLIFLSSGGTVYGEHENKPIKETEEKNPICHYGVIKDLIEKYIKLYQKMFPHMKCRIIRLANPYSIEVKKGQKQGIIPIFIDLALNDLPIKIWGDGEDVRDYIYIEDAMNAIMRIEKYEGEELVFNVGTGIGHSIHDILVMIRKTLKKERTIVEYVPSRTCDVKCNVLDIEKLYEECGWVPEHDLATSIAKIVEQKKRARMKENDNNE